MIKWVNFPGEKQWLNKQPHMPTVPNHCLIQLLLGLHSPNLAVT